MNLLGEHVDYNDGFVLPAAIDRATYIAFSPASTDRTTLVAADFGEEARFTPETLPAKTQPDGSPLPEWAHYPAGTAWALGQAGLVHSGHAGGLLVRYPAWIGPEFLRLDRNGLWGGLEQAGRLEPATHAAGACWARKRKTATWV